ncbi:patatin-like phospholipase family protein [Pedobacter alpinus]|uniref:Patatin-like phospholipase family protein n=1 Tax=Pedobacter alpinus TaxID=1590643 RepID=A0ABW5TS95_9SPHI
MKVFITILLSNFLMVFGYSQTYENLVFEGAGVRGIAYSGVLAELENRKITNNIVKVGGTSAGAITALMVSLGYTSEEIFNIISATKFQKFNDGEFFFIGGFLRMNSKYGWYKGDKFKKWLEKIIISKTGDSEITFSELTQKGLKQLYITATCLNRQKLIVFSAETYPNMKIKDAVRISMSIPLYFEAVFIDSIGQVYNKNKAANLDVVVDGGIIGNFPIFIFDSLKVDSLNQTIRIPNYKTLGIRIDSDLQIKNDSMSKALVPMPINNMNDYLQAFYVLILENLNRTALISADWERTISVSSVGISPRIKKMSAAQKQSLIKSGEISAQKYFNK